MSKFKKVFRIKFLFWFLVILGLTKLFFLLFFFIFHAYTLQAEEKSIKYSGCPKEFSEILLIEKEHIYQKRKELEAKEKELKLLEKRIQEQLLALKELEAIIDEKLKKIEIIRTKKLEFLVNAISKMQPSKAAKMLISMDKDMAVKILSLLRSRQVASILSAMPPDKAAALSEALSGYPPKKY
jgi:flagellar motility protein MotE (MotC chaperone)